MCMPNPKVCSRLSHVPPSNYKIWNKSKNEYINATFHTLIATNISMFHGYQHQIYSPVSVFVELIHCEPGDIFAPQCTNICEHARTSTIKCLNFVWNLNLCQTSVILRITAYIQYHFSYHQTQSTKSQSTKAQNLCLLNWTTIFWNIHWIIVDKIMMKPIEARV